MHQKYDGTALLRCRSHQLLQRQLRRPLAARQKTEEVGLRERQCSMNGLARSRMTPRKIRLDIQLGLWHSKVYGCLQSFEHFHTVRADTGHEYQKSLLRRRLCPDMVRIQCSSDWIRPTKRSHRNHQDHRHRAHSHYVGPRTDNKRCPSLSKSKHCASREPTGAIRTCRQTPCL